MQQPNHPLVETKKNTQSKVSKKARDDDQSEDNAIDEEYAAFADSVTSMAGNLRSITKSVTDGENGDRQLKDLITAIELIENWLLNILSRPDLLVGYCKLVYLSKEAIDRGDGNALIDDDVYLYGDFDLAKPYAPLFKRLWSKHMNNEEMKRVIEFFRAFNVIVENWISAGAEDIFIAKSRKFDRSVVARIGVSLAKLDRIPETKMDNIMDKLAQGKSVELPKELVEHYALLKEIRNENINIRNLKITKTEVGSVTVTKQGNHSHIEGVDVTIEKSNNKTKVTTVKVSSDIDTPKKVLHKNK
jgi:hypothetical protein